MGSTALLGTLPTGLKDLGLSPTEEASWMKLLKEVQMFLSRLDRNVTRDPTRHPQNDAEHL